MGQPPVWFAHALTVVFRPPILRRTWQIVEFQVTRI